MAFRLIAPPRLHLPDARRDRHTTWLETFYDLVFAVAVAALSDRLASNVSPLGLLQFLGLFLPVWWAWLGQTVYNTRFDSDDLVQRLCIFGVMLAAGAMAVTIPRAFEEASLGFAAAYSFARLNLLVLYLRAWFNVKQTRAVTTVYLLGFSLGVSLWIISLFVLPPARYLFWATGLAIDIVTPWLGIWILRRAPLDTSHLPERLGLFTIILLGEVIALIVTSVSMSKEGLPALFAAVLAFCIILCIWWSYFNFLEIAPFVNKLSSGQPYMYLHLPLYIGLTILSVGEGRAIGEASSRVLSAETGWLLGGGLLLWLLSALTLKLMYLQEKPPFTLFIRFSLFFLALFFLTMLSTSLLPLIFIGSLVIVLLLFVISDVYYWNQWREKTAPEAS